MAINTPVDPMAELEALVNEEQKSTGAFTPFFFSIKDGEKALVRPLLNMNQYVKADKHEVFNPTTNKFDVAAICATSLGLTDCAYCAQASTAKTKEEKKLIVSPRIILPVYVHAILNVKTGQPVTYTDSEGSAQPVKGIRLLEMKRSSSILRDFIANYNEDDNHNITNFDFVITRKNIDGDKLQTTYTVISKQPRKIEDEIADDYRDREKVLLLYSDACPFKLLDTGVDQAIAGVVTAVKNGATSGKVKNAPDW